MRAGAIRHLVACGVIAASLSGCANQASKPQPQYLSSPDLASASQEDELNAISDPFEGVNRVVLEDNQKFNHTLLYPIAKAYNETVPQAVRDGLTAFSTNLSEPVVFANDLLQLRPKAAATTLGRFAVNSTVGVGGLVDVAAKQGLEHQSGDFGQTLFVWGYRNSPYLVLPIVGPTNVRDAIGSGIELVAQMQSSALVPAQLLSAKGVVDFTEAIDPVIDVVDVAGNITTPLTNLSKAEDLQALEESSIDFYSMLRSVSDQKRQAELQEALDTSALTSEPRLQNPNGIEPVLTIASSPEMISSPVRPSARATPAAEKPVLVIVGPPSVSGSMADH